ncbi:MAG: DUF5103 domain-containing protein [bacterium]|nr:DUF5103 domain-containing protein [bacterium]
MRHLLFYVFLLLSFPVTFLAQDKTTSDEDYVGDNTLKYDDYTYKPGIKTVMFHESSWDYAAPIISLNTNMQLSLSFDDLDADHKDYSVTFIHCNADWTPSSLMQTEYISGFSDLNFLIFSSSQNTFQRYTHYSISFPQQSLQFTKSGNYLMYVYLNGNRDDLVLSRRMMVFDDKVNCGVTLRQPIGGADRFGKQQLDLVISPQGYDITNPFRDLNVVITQNNRWDNAVTDIKPTFVNGTQLVYSLDEKSTFNGGNEFRFFDMRSLKFLTEKVKDVYRDANFQNHVVIYPDPPRASKAYLFYNDFNGNFLIRNTETIGDMDVQADYVYVDFFLPYPVAEATGNFYILGKLTDWRLNKFSKMTYNDVRLGYEAKLFLKQGYYNYIYVLSSDTKKGGDETIAEGSYWDTENDYNILVYHRKFGTYYDQLIGYKKINTLRK